MKHGSRRGIVLKVSAVAPPGASLKGAETKVRLLLQFRYFLELAKYNLFISVLGGWFGTSLDRLFLEFFLATDLTLGFLGAVYFFHYFQSGEYYFYFNKGLSKSRLNLVATVLNILLGSLAYLLFQRLGWL